MPDSLVEAFKFNRSDKTLQVLDQLLLPQDIKYIGIKDTSNGHRVIRNMNVRGAPCIAAVGCLALITEINQPGYLEQNNLGSENIKDWFKRTSEYLVSSRPTAVNLKYALAKLEERLDALTSQENDVISIVEKLTDFCWLAIDAGKTLNVQLGDLGADEILKNKPLDYGVNVLTHCNTGSLATVGYGTALGVIRSLRNKGRLNHAYCTETRPYNQGSRLTAWELVQEKIPATLIADSMVAYLMSIRKIDAVIVGADRVASNGDTANKIGTYQIAVVARAFDVPFYVAAPTQSIDLEIGNQKDIIIEQRPQSELKKLGSVLLAPEDIEAWNPCFDVTPADLITGGIITEYGVCRVEHLENFVRCRREKENKLLALF